ncbi:MAG: 16S rRNA (cytidine(1402)-2'-O)-methyltransferase [Burkholderiaceae bacterium]
MTFEPPESSEPLSLPFVSALRDELGRQAYPAGTLYVLATPIGNLCDVSLRALHVLSLVDAVACEDTRDTAQLLRRYGLSKPLLAAHRHNEREAGDEIVRRLRDGARIALVSDAGTPGVSDPGARIVDAALAAGLRVSPLPGPSAAIAALSAGGLIEDRFLFVGFLPTKGRQRDEVLASVAHTEATLVFYEAPHRIEETVEALLRALGPARRIVFARELTKLFEEVHRCALAEAPAWLAANPHRRKGEFVLLVEGAPARAEGDAGDAEADRILAILLEACPVSQAAALAAKITGRKKNALYERALRLARE